VSWLSIALLACAVIAVIGAEWPRLGLLGQGRERRFRARRKAQFRLLHGSGDTEETEDFAASVERDLAQLPTIDERDRHK
jgi:hypothetical protein